MLKTNPTNFKERHDKMKRLMAFVVALTMAAALKAASAQFTYQGVLKNTSDVALTGNQTVELRLYNTASATTALWGRSYSVLLDDNGLFNVEVSDVTGTDLGYAKTLETVLAENEAIYIGLKVDVSSGEIKPRQKMLPVPYAAVAANVTRASGNFTVAGTLTAANATFSGELSASSVNVSKSVSAGSLTVNGDATVSGNLAVSGSISGFGVAPVGCIIMWYGSQDSIPTGWVLCDGSNGTPDLRGRFVVGAGKSYHVNKTGGEEEHTLTIAEMPNHSHNYKFTGADIAGSFKKSNYFYCQENPYNLENHGDTEATGGNQPHNNMPPYYALCFIMRKN